MKYFVSVVFFLITFSVNAQQTKTTIPKSIAIDTSKFVLVEGGTFRMGNGTPVEPHEAPAHDVTVHSFYAGKTEVTFNDYDKFCKATQRDTVSSRGFGRGKHPVISVSWLDAIAYCNWRSHNEKLSLCYSLDSTGIHYSDTAKGYRLLTEAEWEYAARGGNKSKGTVYAGSEKPDETTWYAVNSNSSTHNTAEIKSNELGLFDMTGNVWEWVWDWYDSSYYLTSPALNPAGPENGSYRVMRGGAFYNNASYCTVYTRQNSYPNFMQNSVGFRIARNAF